SMPPRWPHSVGSLSVAQGSIQAYKQRHNQDFVPAAGSCAARSAASVVPPDIVERFKDMRCTPLPNSGARLELSVRELTPIHPISDDSGPYSIFGQRFITTLIPAASALAAASSLRTPSCIQITCGFGVIVSASSTTAGANCEARKTSTMSTGSEISDSLA